MSSSNEAVGKPSSSSVVTSWKEASLPGVGNPFGVELVKVVLLFHGVGCYLVQSSLHWNC